MCLASLGVSHWRAVAGSIYCRCWLLPPCARPWPDVSGRWLAYLISVWTAKMLAEPLCVAYLDRFCCRIIFLPLNESKRSFINDVIVLISSRWFTTFWRECFDICVYFIFHCCSARTLSALTKWVTYWSITGQWFSRILRAIIDANLGKIRP